MATTVTLKPNAIDISGSTSGTTTLQATAVAGTTTLTLPAATDTLVGKATTDTLTNKTLTSPTITGGALNGTVGATTPSTGAFTTLSATGVLSVAASAVSTIGGFSASDTPTSMNLRLNRTAAQFNGIAFAGAVTYDRGIYLRPSSDTINIGRSAGGVFTDHLSVDGSGNVKTISTISVGDATPSTSGAGITFPATQSASSNANTLDDYEEGTFTPTLTLTTPGTFSTLAAVGVYTKVGNLVTATGRISFTKGTGSGDLVLGGLPFTSINTATYQNAGALSTDTFGVTGKIYQIILGNNTTVPNLNSVTQAGGAAAAAGVSDFGAAQAAIRYTFSYHV